LALADEGKAPEPQPEPVAIKAEAPRGKAGLRVVRILPESNQALLFDKNRGTHVLADVGSTIAGYKVESIDEDEVTLSANGKELVLTAPQRGGWRSLREERADVAPVAKKAPKAEAPADPYAETTADAPADPYADAGDAPIDPYAEPKPRSVSAPAPIVAGEGGVRVATPHNMDIAPVVDGGAPPTTTAPRSTPAGLDPAFVPATTRAPSWIDPGPAKPATTAPAANTPADPYAGEAPADPYGEPPAPVITPTVLSRSELNVALADFGKLTNLLRGSFTAQGARLDVVADGSVFAKAGLRAGDVVTAVDNMQLRSIDDAADLYVRASATRAANIQVLRAGKPMTLRVLIH
jgi:type II secretory pathway component PulC